MRKGKRTIVMILALMMIMSTMPSYGATPKFKDVPASHWAYKDVEKMADLEYIAGKGNGVFDPNGTLTFEQAMLLLARFTNPTAEERTSASYAYNVLLNQLNVVTWAKEGLAVALYRNIITEDELKDVHKKGLIDKPINRVDTGEYLVKAMDLDDVAKSTTTLSKATTQYKDYLSIQVTQLRYVSVLLDVGVFHKEGKGNGYFEPKSNLTRAEMAKMMSTAYDYLQKNPTTPTKPVPPKEPEGDKVTSTIIKITDMGEQKYLSVDNHRGGEIAYVINKDTSVNIDGKKSNYSELIKGQEVKLIVKKGTYDIISIEAESLQGKITAKIKYLNYVQYKMTVEHLENKKLVSNEFSVDNSAKIYLDGKSVYLRELKEGDLVELEIKNNKIYDIDAYSKIKKIEGSIKEINPVKDSKDKEYYITVIDSKDNIYKSLINEDTTLYRNDRKVDSGKDLKVKDSVYMEVEYDLELGEYIAEYLETEVVRKEIKGLIVGMETRLQEPTKLIILNQKTRKEETYTLGKDIYIRVDRMVSNSYDLKAGFYVELITEGDEITEIEADSIGIEATMIGRVIGVNSRNRSLELEITDFSLDGSKFGDEMTVYAYDTIVISRNGSRLDFDDVYKGDTVNVIGSYDGATFIANTIMILK